MRGPFKIIFEAESNGEVQYQNENKNWFETGLKLVGTGLEQDQTGIIRKIQEFSCFKA